MSTGPTDRMIEVVAILRDGITTADRIARQIGVSERTVYRYIRTLKAVGSPIKGEAGVGYMLQKPQR
jgi:predicted DNA-binding transcriptional regulator YafY